MSLNQLFVTFNLASINYKVPLPKLLSNREELTSMGLTKPEHFTARQNQLAAMAQALAHPGPRLHLGSAHSKNACICSDIVEELSLAQPTVSQHLKELKQAGLIKGEIEGTSICYCINQQVWKEVQDNLLQFFSQLPTQPTEKTNCY
jgi:ArsR family transcriptional regulator